MLKIVTDSSSNITPAEAEALGVEVIPLTVSFGTREYKDGVDLDAAKFYEMLTSAKEFPHTSQINTDTFEEIFLAAKENGDTLLLITIGTELSGTYGAAVRAQANIGYDGIHVYDSRGATVIQKMLVLEAVRRRDESADEIVRALDEVRARCELYAFVDTLEYLYKGGRLKRGAAMLGTLFNVKPVVTISQRGTVDLVGKTVGTRSAIKAIAKKVRPEDIDDNYPVFYIYTAEKEKCARLIEAVTPDGNGSTDDVTNVCPVIGTHIGPGAAGICYVRKKISPATE